MVNAFALPIILESIALLSNVQIHALIMESVTMEFVFARKGLKGKLVRAYYALMIAQTTEFV